MSRGRVQLGAAVLLLALVWAVADFGWMTVALVVGVLFYAAYRAIAFLADGHGEWYRREEARRERRARR